MEDFIVMVANVGFPIVVTGYLLLRMERKMDTLTDAITKLSTYIHLSNNDKNNKHKDSAA